MARRSDHSRDELRDLALTAAQRIVEREGVRSLTARRVAEEIGYTVGTLYLVFRNLDDLILHLNVRTLDDLSAALRKAVAAARRPEMAVRALARAYIHFAQRHPHRWSLVFEHRLGDDMKLPAFFMQRVTALLDLVETALLPLAPGSRSRRARAARALWGGVHGICILGLGGKLDVVGAASVESLSDSLIENYLRGFAAKNG